MMSGYRGMVLSGQQRPRVMFPGAVSPGPRPTTPTTPTTPTRMFTPAQTQQLLLQRHQQLQQQRQALLQQQQELNQVKNTKRLKNYLKQFHYLFSIYNLKI